MQREWERKSSATLFPRVLCCVRECFFSSFDLISCTVYKLNLMSFSIAAAVAAAAAWRSQLFHLRGVREQCYAHEIEKWICRSSSSAHRIGIRLQISIVVVLCFSSFAVVFLNTNSDPYARTKNFNVCASCAFCIFSNGVLLSRCGSGCICEHFVIHLCASVCVCIQIEIY